MIVLILSAVASIIAILAPKLKYKNTFPFISLKNKKKVSSAEYLLIILACVGCIYGCFDIHHNSLEKREANKKSDSLQRRLTDTITSLTRANFVAETASFKHSTRIKDSLNEKIDTLEHQNFQLSKQQFKSFDLTYRRIASSSENLENVITGKNGYFYAKFVTQGDHYILSLLNPFNYNLHSGYIKILNAKDIESIHTKLFETGWRYSRVDLDNYSRTIPIRYVAPGINYTDYIVNVDDEFKPQKFIIFCNLGSSIFQLQAVFFGVKGTDRSIQMDRLYFRVNGNFKFKKDTSVVGTLPQFDWKKEFPLPQDLEIY